MNLFEEAFEVIERIEEAGGEAYIVGGAVRDLLTGRAIGDIDIATSLTPGDVQNTFEKVIPVGIEHGTVIVRHKGTSFEVTTFRTEEGYEDFRHPDEVTFVSDIKEDLARRDFTMNAIAMDRQQNIIDPFRGKEAIEQKLIQAVGEPDERFREDPLRMIRAARFASKLGYSLEPSTQEALAKQAPLLRHIAVERISVEFLKLLAGDQFQNGLEILVETNLIHELPVLREGFMLDQHTPSLSLQTWPETIVFFLKKGFGDSVQDWVKSWKLSNQIRRNSEHLYEMTALLERDGKVTPWLAYQLKDDCLDAFSRIVIASGKVEQGTLEAIRNEKSLLPIRSRKDLVFSSTDLINLFPDRQKGPWIGEGLLEIERAVVQGSVDNDHDQIKKWVQQWNLHGKD
ncbi:CCA tRNA nucleotidyltransferase [Halobacillus litoralis]|uniref:CCA tRNA nucleotidyltransferase n=1 Tax=Halobacillus litoralis TaxID=45668 RepID=UPI001CD7CBC2|nr:CCA tRNA nucleotidyltransferase [Halobacillus litoralis]MCA0970370.1 CCA tRNA nucleotidyltransferase [Halobacillus litoralis]